MMNGVLTAAKVTSLLVKDDPLAYNEGYYNTDLNVCELIYYSTRCLSSSYHFSLLSGFHRLSISLYTI